MIRRAVSIVTTIIVVIMVAIAILMLMARFFGAGSYVVQSGSMEPSYHTGALIIDKKVDVHQLEAGDVITFSIAQDMTATHRIVEVLAGDDADNVGGEAAGTANGSDAETAGTANSSDAETADLRFRTKGDANEEADAEPVDAINVIGTPVLHIPYLGYLIDFVKTKLGMIAAGIFILLILLSEILTTQKRKG